MIVMVRSPGFEPGSSTWQADVLNHSSLKSLGTSTPNDIQMARLRPHETISFPIPTLKPNSTKTEETIINTLIQLKSNGLKEQTVNCIAYKLKRLNQECDLNNNRRKRKTNRIRLSIRHGKRRKKLFRKRK